MKISKMFVTLLMIGSVACSKTACQSSEPEEGAVCPIVFTQEMIEADVDTRASTVTEVSSLSEFNVLCVTGEAGKSEKSIFNNVFSGSGTFTGGQFWPSTNPGYKFYASNVAITAAAAGPKLAASVAVNTKDIVVATCLSPEYRKTNSLTFKHIFAQVGTCKVSAPQNGYKVENLSVTIVPKVSGEYDLYRGNNQTGGTGWTSTKEGGAVTLASSLESASAVGLYLVPGQYVLNVSYSLTKGVYTESFNKTATVVLESGKVSNISMRLPEGNAVEIAFSVTVSPWASTPIQVGELL